MSRFNTMTNQPIIPNAQKYIYEKKYVSVHSEDRDILQYPSSSQFEIELPQDYSNIQSVKLSSWTFPSNYNTFSLAQNNVLMTFKFVEIFNPSQYYISDPLLNAIFIALYNNINSEYLVIIEDGFYDPYQLATELTNRFNYIVTQVIRQYLKENKPELLPEFYNGYDQFVVVYNTVGQKLWFGNKSSNFVLTNDSLAYAQSEAASYTCPKQLPNYSDWGLPGYLGFTRCPAHAIQSNSIQPPDLPRFYYGDAVPLSGDKGFWLNPDPKYIPSDPAYGNTYVYYLSAENKINLMGNSHFYLEIDSLNNLDETVPYYISPYTLTNNQTNGIVNSSFAKIGVISTPISQWFDRDSNTIKVFNPPAERIRKLGIKIRYHNGVLVDFGLFNFSLTLEFTFFRPQSIKKFQQPGITY